MSKKTRAQNRKATPPKSNIDWGGPEHDLRRPRPVVIQPQAENQQMAAYASAAMKEAMRPTVKEIVVQIAGAMGKSETPLEQVQRETLALLGGTSTNALLQRLLMTDGGRIEMLPIEKVDGEALHLAHAAVAQLAMTTYLPFDRSAPWAQVIMQLSQRAFLAGQRQATDEHNLIHDAISEVADLRHDRYVASIIKVIMQTLGMDRIEIGLNDIARVWDDKLQLDMRENPEKQTLVYKIRPARAPAAEGGA